tara:strand:+ start:491 stop:697 length:207 start_codon:yes stop_codon:yes gene_type:complete
MKKKLNQNPFKHYLIGTQMAIIVLVFVFLGNHIDQYLNHTKKPITIILAILSIIYVLYALIKDVGKEK